MYELLKDDVKEKLNDIWNQSTDSVNAQISRAVDDLHNKTSVVHLELCTCMKLMDAIGEDYENIIHKTILLFNDGE